MEWRGWACRLRGGCVWPGNAMESRHDIGTPHAAMQAARDEPAIPCFPIGCELGRMPDMRNESLGDVLKVWLYAAASVLLGAWISPVLYNAGKALAEVSVCKVTNGPLEWLAKLC